jgi:phage baseplate assembly protein W
MQPNFGSIIWGLLFEPLDDGTHQAIIDDVKRIVGYDPRISLQNLTIIEQDFGIQLELDLLYIPTNQATALSLQFDSDSSAITTNGPY